MESAFSIKQAAEKTGIAENAIRYYEKIGLLPPAARKPNGHRMYSARDMETIELITCLKKTGMTLEEMKEYIALPFRESITSIPEMRVKVENYRERVIKQIHDLQRIVEFIDEKLARNQSLLKEQKRG